ncbi:MAG: RIP metalloprotease RseP [Nitrospinota bacterium]|nr:RIP metalloprotease RseP [Nitrospinota bacterium]
MGNIVAAIILLGMLIFVHELGHFLVAKWMGVGVEKFSLGFGKKILGKQIGETEYLLSMIPLGGYVKLVGEDPTEDVSEVDLEKSFSAKPVLSRLAVVVAGPLFNIIFAVLILSSVYMLGIQVPSGQPIVGATVDGYPAQEAGLVAGDRVLSIDGQRLETWSEMAAIIHASAGKEVNIAVERSGNHLSFKVTPRSDEKGEIGFIGIEPMLVLERYSVPTAFKYGTIKSWEISVLILSSIRKMFAGEISMKNLGGPILIAQEAGRSASQGFLSYFTFAAIISINLGLLNLFPIPVLDGGHILFFLIEIVIGRPVNINIREKAQQVGMFLLMAFMIFAFYNDILRLVH